MLKRICDRCKADLPDGDRVILSLESFTTVRHTSGTLLLGSVTRTRHIKREFCHACLEMVKKAIRV